MPVLCCDLLLLLLVGMHGGNITNWVFLRDFLLRLPFQHPVSTLCPLPVFVQAYIFDTIVTTVQIYLFALFLFPVLLHKHFPIFQPIFTQMVNYDWIKWINPLSGYAIICLAVVGYLNCFQFSHDCYATMNISVHRAVLFILTKTWGMNSQYSFQQY